MAAAITLCAVFAYYFHRYQYGEYVAKSELQNIYSTDRLTKVGNRIKLEEEADRWMEFCSRHNLELSLVLIDIDNLKQINDEYGHLIGDHVLFDTAQVMCAQLRKNDVCARWGGDEFVLLLPYTGVEKARALSERIRKTVSEHLFRTHIKITCSFGIAGIKKGCSLEQLIEQADHTMYLAKKEGKNSVMIDTDTYR